ncbi:hypothetical protein HU200_053335 [Digitaria exilis]|uniref:Leucine-rich repeat-containing N-terminal plant-type domain-containing protein n=1 Tax=Digitaria exilis TaxID=1010633 RepID=A0A835APP5_9POAL|nr:hypothetical protein HU200_053335 [Digitaria exilis]
MAATPGSSFHVADAVLCLLLFLFAPTVAAVSSVSGEETFNGSCIAAEREALLSFKAGITGDPAGRLRSWRGQDCCRWYGVRCSARTGHVVKLDLSNPFFEYDILGYDDPVRWLRGQISSSLLSLRHLKHLDLSGNDLGGYMPMPELMGSLTSLTHLYLSNMNFSGRVPPQLGNLTKLVHLDIHNSYDTFPYSSDVSWLAGPFPDELGNLTMLETLDMSFNNIEGMIPSTLENLCSLRSIDLSINNIGGDITDLIKRLPKCSWNKLQVLNLMQGNITGTTLKSVLNLTTLSMLLINKNHLIGSVPVEIATLENLTELYIGNNGFSGVISEGHFAGLRNLKGIDLSRTYLQLMVDSDWEPPFNLNMASFSSCHLGPQIPNWLQSQNNISYLDLSDTSIIGRIPYWFWNTFSKATYLDLSHNQITGELPLNLDFMSVTELLLQSNHLTGSIPQLPGSIEILDISENSLNGQLPSNFGAPNLQFVVLFSNCITGHIPESICRWPQLRALDLSNNLLTMGLPDCDRKELKKWNPFGNNSSGVNFESSYILEIHTLLLNNNNLSGGFPLFLKQCKNLMFLDLSLNEFSGNLPAWISEAMPSLVMLQLRSNNFSGQIPNEITRLDSLLILDLANNNFSGEIPQSLVNLKALTASAVTSTYNPFQEGHQSEYTSIETGLYNDSSQLVIKGQVVEYRENAIFPMSIDLSCNRVPSGHQLDTLKTDDPSSMYMGNPGLCGHPLPKPCPGDHPLQKDPVQWHEDDSTRMEFHLGLAVGFLFGLWIIFCGLLFKKTWRYAYFSQFDKLYDKVGFSGSLRSPKIDVAIDMGNPFLNRTVDGFLKIGAVGACKVAAEETFECLNRGYLLSLLASPFTLFITLLRVQSRYFKAQGTVAGVYVGMVYGVERVRGRSDWKNAMIGGALSGALISGASNNNKDKIIKDAITAGAVATAVEFVNYLT